MTKAQTLSLLVILCLGFLIRLYRIDNPVADWHSWRQADTSAVTRNYIKYGFNLLYPRYDDFSDVSGKGLYNPHGYRFVEFPIFNIFHYLLVRIAPFGSLEFWGRITSVFAALASAVFLFFIVRRHTTPLTGLLSAGFYLFLPYNIYFTRVILPDPLMVTFFLAALNFHDLKKHWLTLIFGALAILVKPVAIFFLLPVFIFNLPLAVVMLFPFGLWRLWSYRHPEGIPASLWLLNGNHIRFKGAFFQWIFGTRLGALILGKWGIWPFLVGLVNSPPYFLLWGVGAVLYLFTFATGNVQHDYYQIPIIPVVAVFLAWGTTRLFQPQSSFFRTWLTRGLAVVAVLFALAFSWYDERGLYQINNWSIVHAGQAVDKLTPANAVVVAPYQGDTAFLYQTNRRGFPFMMMPIKDMIDKFGATYYVSVVQDSDTKAIMAKYTVVAQTPEYVIVRLVEPVRPVVK